MIERVLERIMTALNLRHKTELARLLSVSHAAIYSAINKGKVPQRWLTKLAHDHNLNPNWMLTGEGPMKIEERSSPSLLSRVGEVQRDNVLLEEVRAAVESFSEQLKKHELVMEDMSEEKKMKWIMFCYKILQKEDAADIPRGTVEEEVHRQMGSILL